MDGGLGELLLAALGLYLVIEGSILALFPDGFQRMMAVVQQLPPSTLRAIGLAAAVSGVVIVWLVRG
ncbi:MAG: DUF2065 domain-containing protein [Alphaproteobacteria bacterium]|nr:DUF2065 domain-containing protein [Alphaproteobacteria bacterium]